MRSRADRRIVTGGVGAALCALAAWSLVASAGWAAQPSQGLADADCREVKLISVRGTGDNLNLYGWIGSRVSDALVKRARAAGVSYGVLGVDYPARGWPDVPQYPFSKNKGRDELGRVIKAQAAQCPSQKLALLGYSQGAHVVSDVLSKGPSGRLTPGQLAKTRAVALIADPRFNSREPFAAGSFRPGRNGFLGARSPGDLDGVKGRISSWCRKDDFWCQGPGNFGEHKAEKYWADYGEEIIDFLARKLGWREVVPSVNRPVVKCPTTDVVGAPIGQGPPRVNIPADAAVAKRMVGYDASQVVILGPIGWKCSSMIFGNGGQSIAIWPSGQKGASFGQATDPWPRPLAITVTYIPGCIGCRASLICPYFPADAAEYGQPCTSGVPAGEKVARVSPIAVTFEDPPYVKGTSSYSGGRLRVRGVVISVMDRPRRQGFAIRVTCALNESSQDICAATLKGAVARFRAD